MAFLDKAGLERLWLHINSKLNKINNATKVIDKATGDSLSINNSANQKPIGVKLFGKTSQSSVPALETPSPLVHLGQDGNIKTTFCGKNLVDINKFQASNASSAKEVTDNTIRVYTITNRTYAGCNLPSIQLIKGQTYTLSASVDSIIAGTPRIGFRETATNAFISGTSLLFSETGRKSITFTASRTVSAYLSILVTWDTETNGDVTFSNIQIEMNNKETEYEPYEDGGFITISTPNGLRGMKVTEGGNYTDQYGQQWIADEADLVSNTINTRIREYIIDGRTEQSISTIEALTNVVRFWAYIPELKGMSTSANNYIMCDKLPVANSYEEDSIGILNGTTIGPGYPRSVVLKLPLAAGTTTAELQAYLATNPLSVMTVVNEVEEVSLEVNSEELYMQNPITNVNNTDVAGLEVEYATTKMDDLKEALDGSLQSDWEQNDENANDYIKNRTHWEEPLVTNTLVDNVSVTIPDSPPQVTDPFTIDIVVGTTYLVTFDDVVYECVAYLEPIYSNPSIGNIEEALKYLPVLNTGEPFYIQSAQGSILLNASSGTHIITIQEVVSGGTHKIDSKFLQTPDWDAKENEPGYIANKTHWSDFEYETVIDNLSITLTEYNGAYSTLIPFTLTPYTTGLFEITWNGISYKTCMGMGPQAYFIGNPAILYGSQAPDNGLPFGIGFSYASGFQQTFFVCLEIPASPILTIKELTEKVHKIDPKFIHTPNWNAQEDESGYIANKTHWVEYNGDTIYIISTTVNLTNNNGGYNGSTISPTINIIEGARYQVYWNDTEYDCVAYFAQGPNCPAIGAANYAGVPGGNGEPFFIYTFNGTTQVMSQTSSGDTEIYIAKYKETVHKIDPKYLPEMTINLVNGSATGSVRGIGTDEESETYIMGDYAFAEGRLTAASGHYSHAEGVSTTASGEHSHAEGSNTTASGNGSHAEGGSTTASGVRSHAEGIGTTASGNGSHTEGYYTIAGSNYQHVQGECNIEDTENKYAHIVGNGTQQTPSNAHTLDWDGNAWFAGNVYVGGSGQEDTENIQQLATQEDVVNTATTIVNEGKLKYIFDGSQTGSVQTSGSNYNNDESYTIGMFAFAEGMKTEASGQSSHAEGSNTTASGDYSHAEGYSTEANGEYSHTEGYYTKANGHRSHAEGNVTTASGYTSHAEGSITTASGANSHAEGYHTIAASTNQHVQGLYNIEDTDNKYAHIVGNGESEDARSNAHTLDWDGNAWFAGNIKIGGTGQTDTAASLIATQNYVLEQLEVISVDEITSICS